MVMGRGLPRQIVPMLPPETQGYQGYQGYTGAPKPVQSVAEILSQGSPGQPMPDLGGATSAASRQRQIADMLMQGAQQQDNRSIAGGLSQLGQAFLARRAGQKADTAEDKQREVASLLLQQAIGEGPESQAARAQLFADNPAAMVAQSDAARRQAVEDTRYADERDYMRGRDKVEDVRFERQWLRDQNRYETQQEFQERVQGFTESSADRDFNLRERIGGGQLDLGWAELEARKAEAKAKSDAEGAPKVPEFGDTWKMREAFEKRAQGFEEAQRQYFMMGDLAKDSTGASDIALGFAFFKTIDPTSTVREGEFAAAASSMGLNAALVQQFARLDKGEKFSPQLRQDLLQAAGHAYKQQAQDIEGLYERESQFASRMGADPSLIVRNPVRQTQGNGTVFRGGVVNQIPQGAIEQLLSDPTPENSRFFDEQFGQGQAQKVLQQRNMFPSRITF